MRKLCKSTIILGLFLIVTSCNDQLESPSTIAHGQANPSTNILKFDSVEDFENTTHRVSEMTVEELDSWEKSKNFTSFRSVLAKAYNELDSVNTEEEKSSFIDKYKDILSFKDDRWVPLIEIPFYQKIVNREGIYETNGYLNKVIGDLIITVKKEDLEELKKLDYTSASKLNQKAGLKIFQYTGINTQTQTRVLATPCSTDMTTSYFYNKSNCKNDRKVFFNAKSYIASYSDYRGDWRQPRVGIKVWGERRKGTWCNWVPYYTALSYRNITFDIFAWENQTNGTPITKLYSKSLPDYAPTNDRDDLTWDQSIGDPVLNNAISAYPFQRFYGEGSSRGVDNNWAVLDCVRIY